MDRTEKLKLQKMTVAAVAIAAALTMTACGSDDKTDSPTTTSKTTTTTTASDSTDAPVALLPTAPELNAKSPRHSTKPFRPQTRSTSSRAPRLIPS